MKIAGIFPQITELDPRLDPDPEEPLGIEYVLSSAKTNGHTVQLFVPKDLTIESMIQDVLLYQPDLVALSVYTKHVPDSLVIAKAIKKRNPDVVIVAGGPHPSAAPELAQQEDIDFCVIGEGELTFVELLDAICDRKPFNDINGISYQGNNGELIITSQRDRIENLDLLPAPLHARTCYQENGYSVYDRPNAELSCASMVCSRGCPYNCKFCSSPDLWQRKVKRRTIKNVIEEIQELQREYGVNFVFFEDLTFCLDVNYVRDLCDSLIKYDITVSWWCQTTTKRINGGKLLGLMRKSGCSKIGWGIESTELETLSKVNKINQKSPPSIKETIETLHGSSNLGIINLGYTMIGLPWETENSILNMAEKLDNYDIHQLRIAIATPLPGSQWYKEMPKSSLNPDLSLYDTNHLVYDHPTISPARMKELQNEVFVRFYRSTKYRNKVAKMIRDFPHLKDGFDEFLAYIDGNIDKILVSSQS